MHNSTASTNTRHWLLGTFEYRIGWFLPQVPIYTYYLSVCKHRQWEPLPLQMFDRTLRDAFPVVRSAIVDDDGPSSTTVGKIKKKNRKIRHYLNLRVSRRIGSQEPSHQCHNSIHSITTITTVTTTEVTVLPTAASSPYVPRPMPLYNLPSEWLGGSFHSPTSVLSEDHQQESGLTPVPVYSSYYQDERKRESDGVGQLIGENGFFPLPYSS